MSLGKFFSPHSEKDLSKKKKTRLIIGLVLFTLVVTIGGTYAANISLGSSQVEFGQGTTLASACDDDILVTAQSKVTSGTFLLDRVTVSKINPATCAGKKISVYLDLTVNGTKRLGKTSFVMDYSSGTQLEPLSGAVDFSADDTPITPSSNAVTVSYEACNADGCTLILNFVQIPSSSLDNILLETSED